MSVLTDDFTPKEPTFAERVGNRFWNLKMGLFRNIVVARRSYGSNILRKSYPFGFFQDVKSSFTEQDLPLYVAILRFLLLLLIIIGSILTLVVVSILAYLGWPVTIALAILIATVWLLKPKRGVQQD